MMPAPTVRKLPLSLNSGKFRGAIIGGVVTLFHQRFIDELNLLNVDNLQYFPIGLENPNGDIDDRYSLVNVVGLLEAVDVGASVIRPRATGGKGQLLSFTIDAEKTKGSRLFRLFEDPKLIIIDQYLRDKISKVNPPGIMMLPTERYNGV